MKHTKRYGKKTSLALGMWIKLARAFSTFNRLSTQDINRYGLTQPQFAALECLGHCGSLKLRDLSHKMLVSGGNMTVVVDNLEKDGLVQRCDDPNDRRAYNIALTPKGKKLFEETFVQHAEFIARAASVLTEEEQTDLSHLLKKLGHALKVHPRSFFPPDNSGQHKSEAHVVRRRPVHA